MDESIYCNNSQKEIIKLKNDLIYDYSSSSNNSSKIISDVIHQIKNEEIGHIFEENIRKLLQFKLNWIIGEIPRAFSYREISIKNETFIVIPSKPVTIKLDDEYIFSINEDESLEVKNITAIEKIINIPKNEGKTLTYKKALKINISEPKKIEMDGFFKIKNFNLAQFDSNEVIVLFNGIDKNEDISSYDYAIIEAKLSQKKIKEMLEQIKRDKFVCEKILKRKVLLIGFTNSTNLDIDISGDAANLNCIIFGLKNSHLFGRDVTKFYDWTLINDIERIKDKYDDLTQKIDFLISLNKESKKKGIIHVRLRDGKNYYSDN